MHTLLLQASFCFFCVCASSAFAQTASFGLRGLTQGITIPAAQATLNQRGVTVATVGANFIEARLHDPVTGLPIEVKLDFNDQQLTQVSFLAPDPDRIQLAHWSRAHFGVQGAIRWQRSSGVDFYYQCADRGVRITLHRTPSAATWILYSVDTTACHGGSTLRPHLAILYRDESATSSNPSASGPRQGAPIQDASLAGSLLSKSLSEGGHLAQHVICRSFDRILLKQGTFITKEAVDTADGTLYMYAAYSLASTLKAQRAPQAEVERVSKVVIAELDGALERQARELGQMDSYARAARVNSARCLERGAELLDFANSRR